MKKKSSFTGLYRFLATILSCHHISPKRNALRNYFLRKCGLKVANDCLISNNFFFLNGTNIEIQSKASIGIGAKFFDFNKITIEEYVMMANDVIINTGTHSIDDYSGTGKEVHIERGVWIGLRVTILPGVTIGRNSVVGACSLVNKDIPPNSIAYGIPAKVKSTREPSKKCWSMWGSYSQE